MRTLVLIAVMLAGCDADDGQGQDADLCKQGARCDHGTSCSIEGLAICDGNPVSGGCACGSGGTWECFSSCPDGCPTTLPAQGAACTLAAPTICTYEGSLGPGNRTECSCVDQAFDCR
jgi:hypothetical protein